MRARHAFEQAGLARSTAKIHSAHVDPWSLVWGQPYIDAKRLANAIVTDLEQNPNPDFRTRLLVRDAVRALRRFWNKPRFTEWLRQNPVRSRIEQILAEQLGPQGFPHIRRRLVESNTAIQVRQILDLLGRDIHDRIDVYIAGSIPTLINGLTVRPTADIDFVDEVPAAIRKQRAKLEKIKASYGLTLGHVQSHYLPTDWRARCHSLGDYGRLRVYLVDEYDIFVSKLSSKQAKHLDDLRVLAGQLDESTARRRLLGPGKAFLDNPRLRSQIEKNWQFIYQAPLFPPQVDTAQSGESKPTARTRQRRRSNPPPKDV